VNDDAADLELRLLSELQALEAVWNYIYIIMIRA
jgi:hypothetical protein